MRIEWNDQSVKKALKGAVETASLNIARNIAIDAKMLAPVETGKLVMSIEAKKSKFKNGGAVVMAGGGDEYYATFQELGTRKMQANPFMRPALEKNRDGAIKLIGSELKNKL